MCIKTKRLEIRPYEDKDRAAMIGLLTNEEIKKTYMIPDFKDKQELERMLHKLDGYSHSKEHYVRGIYLNNELIGFVNDVEIVDGTIEIGYLIHPSQKGRGYATEAVGAVISDLFSRGYKEVLAAAFEHNTASFRVMQKCGMEKIQRCDTVFYNGENHICYYYAITNKSQL